MFECVVVAVTSPLFFLPVNVYEIGPEQVKSVFAWTVYDGDADVRVVPLGTPGPEMVISLVLAAKDVAARVNDDCSLPVGSPLVHFTVTLSGAVVV
jgi:hypothetical protein